MHSPKYCLFYDNHTMPACPDVGENFDAELFTDRVKACGVDYLTFHARCNMGMAYYDTKIGIKHPSLKYDLFGKLADACKRKGIALTAYLNGGISNEEGLRHREWTTLYFDGREYREPRFTPYVRTMCYNSPYRDHLIAMVEEIARNYPVAGFFIDCLAGYPCVCPACVREMKERGIDWKIEKEVEKFSEFSAIRLSRDIAKAAKAVNPEYLLYFNGPSYEEQAQFGTYIECECLPTGPGWGYEFLPVLSHYMRTLGDKPILNMSGRFYDWGDFGGLRPESAIKSELLYGLANGMRPNVGGHFHPRGDLETAVLDRIEKIYKELQTIEPWFDNAENLTEIAVVYPGTIRQIRFDKQLRGAVRMLCELKQQFDIVTEFSDWSKYKLFVIPDDVTLNAETTRRVKAHLASGKAVISSGSSGMNPEKTQFVLEREWGIKFERECDFDPAYFAVGKNFNKSLPDMPLSLYSSGIEVKSLPGTSTEAYLIKPYYNRHWNGEHAFFYNPPDKVTDNPALTICGKVAHFSHRIFSGYNLQAPVELRQLFANVLGKFLPEPLLKTENLPSFARAFVTEQPGRRIVHILSYVPELRGEKTEMIEDAIPILNAKIAMRADGKILKSIYLAPERKEIKGENHAGFVHVNIPVINGYAMVVFQE
ncbi:MAG: alpha-L-fucosidase [Lentisphaerae bacterium]|nr:alpha-L-fucosidase [Lentisphaerota bacterium]